MIQSIKLSLKLKFLSAQIDLSLTDEVVMKVAIIGAGIAGLTLARVLEKFDISYDLFDESESLKLKPAGLILTPNGSAVLQELNLLNEIQQQSQMISSLEYSDEVLTSFFKVECEKLQIDQKFSLLGIENSELKKILLSGLPTKKVHFSHHVIDISKRVDKTLIKFQHGDSRDYDLVVAADGIHSTIRNIIYPYLKPEFSGLCSWHFIVDQRFYPMSQDIAFELLGKSKSFNIFGLKNKRWSWSVTAGSLPHQIDESESLRKNLKQLFLGFDPTVVKLMAESPMQNMVKRDLYELPPITQMESGRVVFIGDAGHSLPSLFHQGPAQAIEDAWYLGKTLLLTKDIDTDLKELTISRKKRIQFLLQTTSILEEVGHFRGQAIKKLGHKVMKFMPNLVYEQMMKKLFKIKL
ncbi:MAG: FAD-dependent monooxygenase [Bacteriovoracaceae bacterium]